LIPLFIEKTPVHRRTGKIPFGYSIDPANPHRLLPDIEKLQVLEDGLNFRIQGHPSRKVAAWIAARAGCYFDHRMVDRHLARQLQARKLRQRTLLPLPEVLSDEG
jgi:hypothetical protein